MGQKMKDPINQLIDILIEMVIMYILKYWDSLKVLVQHRYMLEFMIKIRLKMRILNKKPLKFKKREQEFQLIQILKPILKSCFDLQDQQQIKMNIKYLIYSRYSTSIPIFSINQQQSNKTISSDADKMTSKIKALRSKQNDRDKLRTAYGVWYVTHDQNDIAYAVCTSQEYPERHAFGLIQKLQEKIKEINHCEYQSEENIKAFSKKTAIELATKYNDLSKVDKVHKAQSQVKNLQTQLGVGIKKLVQNQQTLTQMQDKADRMKSYAANFQKNSDKLQRMMYWRNMKIKIIVGLMIIGLIGFVVLIIVKNQK